MERVRRGGRQLRARGNGGWSVGEGKEERWCDEGRCRVVVGGLSSVSRRRRNAGRGSWQRDRRLTDAAVAEAGALIGVTVPILVRISRRGIGRGCGVVCGSAAMARSCRVGARMAGRADGQTAVHGAGMKLSRLGQRDGEPERHDSRKSAEQPVAMHASNIRCGAQAGALSLTLPGWATL